MIITRTKDGAVSFRQMSPDLAQLLVDLASDIAAGAQVLHKDGRLFEPTPRGERELNKVGKAYDVPTASTGSKAEWDDLWTEVK